MQPIIEHPEVNFCHLTAEFRLRSVYRINLGNIIPPEIMLGEGILKICTKFTGEQPCRSVISIKLQSNFIGITLRHECCPVNLLHIFRTPLIKNISVGLLLSCKWFNPLINNVLKWSNSF